MPENQVAVDPNAPGAAAAGIPGPVTQVEQEIVSDLPKAVQPAAEGIEAQFNAVVADAAAKAPEAEALAEEHEPVFGKLASDAHDILTGQIGSVQQDFTDLQAGFKESKVGYKTTEFWLSLIVILLAQVGALSLPGHYGKTVTTAAAAAAYAVSRGLAKSGVPSPL